MSLFEGITIRAMHPDGWPIDFALKPGAQPGPAMEWLEEHGYAPAELSATETRDPGEEASFMAETITATVDDGKAYWKVKGGPFSKFGVIVWPEVLAPAGFDADQMNPMKPVDIRGWTAVYLTKANGQPKKVVRLVPPGGAVRPQPAGSDNARPARKNGMNGTIQKPRPGRAKNRPGANVERGQPNDSAPASSPPERVEFDDLKPAKRSSNKPFDVAIANDNPWFKSPVHVESARDLLGIGYPQSRDEAAGFKTLLMEYAKLRADGVEREAAIEKLRGGENTGDRPLFDDEPELTGAYDQD